MLRFITCGLTILLASMRYKIGIAVGMLTLGLALCAADGAREPKYQRAVDLFESKGDVKGAMQLFEDVAKSPDRNLAARALLYIGACDEKVGEVGAQKAYERVVREFADQPAAAQARIRLAEINNANPPPAAMTQRKIETAGRSFRTSDTDGQKVVYRDDASGELIYGDLDGNHKRVIFKAKPDDLPGWIPSKDMSLVALMFRHKPGRPRFYAVIKTDGTGYREVAHDNPEGDRFGDAGIVNWSWDNRLWVFAGSRGVLVMSVANGEVRQVVPPSGYLIGNASFSPDGRWIAYRDNTYKPESGFEAARERILVVPTSGGDSRVVYEQPSMSGPWPRLADWTSDNRYIAAIVSPDNRISLQLIPVSEGRSAGPRILVRYTTVGNGFAKPGGGLVYEVVKPGGLWAAHTAALDETGRVGPWQRLTLRDGSVLGSTPVWSPDGSQVMFRSTSEDQSGVDSVKLLDLSTGRDRVLPHNADCRSWDRRELRLLCSQSRGNGRFDVVWVAPDSGEIEPIHTFGKPYLGVSRRSRDGRALFLSKPGATDLVQDVVRWDIATGQETLAYSFHFPKDESMGTRLSPDERWLIRNNGRDIEICPLGTGDWKAVATLDSSVASNYYGAAFTPDGNWLFYLDRDAAGKLSIFRVSTAGGNRQRMGDFPGKKSEYGALSISPDDGKILAHTWEVEDGWEIWTLENFLPAGPEYYAPGGGK